MRFRQHWDGRLFLRNLDLSTLYRHAGHHRSLNLDRLDILGHRRLLIAQTNAPLQAQNRTRSYASHLLKLRLLTRDDGLGARFYRVGSDRRFVGIPSRTRGCPSIYHFVKVRARRFAPMKFRTALFHQGLV